MCPKSLRENSWKSIILKSAKSKSKKMVFWRCFKVWQWTLWPSDSPVQHKSYEEVLTAIETMDSLTHYSSPRKSISELEVKYESVWLTRFTSAKKWATKLIERKPMLITSWSGSWISLNLIATEWRIFISNSFNYLKSEKISI